MSAAPSAALDLDRLPTPLAIIRLAPSSEIPAWTAHANSFLSITRTAAELSVVADLSAVPIALRSSASYIALRVRGPLPLELVGILASIAVPLAQAGIPIFPIATFDTDYVLIRETDMLLAVRALVAMGHRVW